MQYDKRMSRLQPHERVGVDHQMMALYSMISVLFIILNIYRLLLEGHYGTAYHPSRLVIRTLWLWTLSSDG